MHILSTVMWPDFRRLFYWILIGRYGEAVGGLNPGTEDDRSQCQSALLCGLIFTPCIVSVICLNLVAVFHLRSTQSSC